ncbi:MAG: hypothetical protein ABIT58_08260, partial [Ferruginibacter sp.]
MWIQQFNSTKRASIETLWSKIMLGIFFSFTMNFTCAQANIKLKEQPVSDTNRILQLIEKGSLLTDQLPQQAFEYLNDALLKSRQLNYLKGIALSSAKLGKWYFGNDIGKAISLARQALDSYQSSQWRTADNIVEVHLLLAESYDEQGKTDSSAYYYYLLSDELNAGDIPDPNLAISIFTKLSIFWMNLDNGAPNQEYVKTTQR